MPLTIRFVDDAERWDRFVCAHPHGHLLQCWAWGALKAHYGWRPARVGLLDGEQLVAGAQVLFRRFPLGAGAMGYIPKGPVIAPDSPLWADLLAALRQAARAERAPFVRLEPEWEMGQAPALAELRHAPDDAIVQAPATIMIDLRPSSEAILAQMKPKWRYNIRLAERKGISVRIGGESDLPLFHRLSQITAERDGFPIRTEEYYRTAYTLFAQGGSAALFVAEYEGKPLAALMAFVCGRMAIYLYGASSDEERNRMPNHLVQWRAMQWAKERGCEVYDLWGAPDPGEGYLGQAARVLQTPARRWARQEAVSPAADGKSEPAETKPETEGSGGATDPGVNGGEARAHVSARSAKLPIGLLRFKEGFGGRLVRYAGVYDIVYQPILYRGLNWLLEKRRARRATVGD
jgi:lipid II:glycine glycyltransferase (peptidoglycan interpeptide bridge formation enzyme)